MKIVINFGEIGSGSVIYPDKARVAFDGIMSVYEKLATGVLDTLEMVRVTPDENSRDLPNPFNLEVTLCRKLQGPSSTGCIRTIEKDFSAGTVEMNMLQAIKQLMDGLSYDATQRQESAAQILKAFKASTTQD